MLHFLMFIPVLDFQTAVLLKKVIQLWLQLWDQTRHTW